MDRGEPQRGRGRTPVGASGGTALRVHLALLAVQLVFSGFHVWGKQVLGEVHPLAVACLRAGFAAPLLTGFAAWHDRRLPRLRQLPALALLGALGVFASQVLFVAGLARTTATNAAILMPSVPVFAAGIGALFGIDRVGPRRLVGILLAVGGALTILDPTAFSLRDQQAVGNLLVVGTCLCYGAFLVFQRPVHRHLGWRTVIAGSFVFGAVGVFAVGGDELAATDFGALSAGTLGGLAYILVFPTLIGYALNTWAVRRSSPTLVAAYTTLQPVGSAVLATLLLGERFGPRQAAGFALIAAGLWVVSRRSAAVRRAALSPPEG